MTDGSAVVGRFLLGYSLSLKKDVMVGFEAVVDDRIVVIVTSDVFVNSIGIGLDASICGAVNRSKWKKRFQAIRMGRFIYLYYVLKELFLFKPFTLKAEVDGKHMEFSNVWFMVAANQPYFGGGMKIAPEARGDDHKLHVLIVKDVSPFIFLLVFATVLWGRHTGLRWVNAFTCTSIAVDSEDSSVPVQADGELIGHKACAVKILPGAVNIRTI